MTTTITTNPKPSSSSGTPLWKILIIIGILGGIIGVILWFTIGKKITHKGGDNGGGGNDKNCQLATKPTCVKPLGSTITDLNPKCNDDNIYECPDGTCESDMNSYSLTSCPTENQQCDSDSFKMSCFCPTNGSALTSDQYSAWISKCNAINAGSLYCDETNNPSDPLQCGCDSSNISLQADTDTKNSCAAWKGTIKCKDNKWYCACGTNPLTATTCSALGYQGTVPSCDTTNNEIQCLCGQYDITRYQCPNTSDGKTQVATGCQGNTIICQERDSLCDGQTIITCTTGVQAQCTKKLDNSGYEWTCPGVECGTSNNSCVGTAAMTSKMSYNRMKAIFGINCLLADDMVQCMTDASNYYASDQDNIISDSSKIYQTTNPGDYLTSNCLPNFTSSSSYCTRSYPPSPIAVKNNSLTTLNSATASQAGLLAPTIGMLTSNSNAKPINGFGSLAKYKLSDLGVTSTPMHRFSYANANNYGDALVIIPQPRGCDSQYSQNSQTIYWVILPVISTRTNAKQNLHLRIMPMQHFHPFLLWRFAPMPYKTDSNGNPSWDCQKPTCNAGYWGKATYHGSMNNLRTTNAYFFILMHYSSLTFVDPSGCHAIGSPDDGGNSCTGSGVLPGQTNLAPMNTIATSIAGYETTSTKYDPTKVTAFMLRGKDYIFNCKQTNGGAISCGEGLSNLMGANVYFTYNPSSSKVLGLQAQGEDFQNMLTINVPYLGDSCKNALKPSFTDCNNMDSNGFTKDRDISGDSGCPFDDSCNSYFAMPNHNSNHRIDYLTLEEGNKGRVYDHPTNSLSFEHGRSLLDLNGPTRFTMLSVSGGHGNISDSTRTSDSNNYFTKYADSEVQDVTLSTFNRSGVTIPFVRYPMKTKQIPFGEDPSLYFVAPIQYALIHSKTVDTYVQFYNWNYTFTNWYTMGLLYHDISSITKNYSPSIVIGTQVTLSPKPINDLSDNMFRWYFYSTCDTTNIKTPCTQTTTKVQQNLLNDYAKWTTNISFRDSSANQWYLKFDTTYPVKINNVVVPGIYNLSYSKLPGMPTSNDTSYQFTVTPNGYIVSTATGNVQKVFLGVYHYVDSTTDIDCLVWINIYDVEENAQFYIPMWSFLFDLKQ
jgi:hypothetical protein